MTYTDWSISPSSQKSTEETTLSNAPKNDLAGAAASHDTKASVDSVIADAGEKCQQGVYNLREVRDILADAIDHSIAKSPYTTLLLAAGLGFICGATWRR